MRIRTLSFFTSLVVAPSVVFASDHALEVLMSMSLEDLSMLEVSVTSASKREQHISEIPAAIYVISNERIVRSGAKTIANALSLAPGVEVSQFNESSDFVSSRGFHDGLFNKIVLNYKDIDYKDSYVDVDDLFSLNTRLGWQKHEHAPLVEVMINNIGMSTKCELETYTDDHSCRGYESEQSIYGRVSYEF